MGTLTSSSSSFKCWKYNVYLSFQGEDTRKNFTDHLYFTLKDARVNVFTDGQVSLENDLNRQSKGLKSLSSSPQEVFYDVDPSDVRNQTGSFAITFLKHE
ncbi:TMV resistance protein N-like [Malus domestica]|uniref:TMV resistance protein N-like n=1 Tax=Malus domestica TaxID=3750 RepID=UPI00397695FB